ncbi:WD-40 repeat-containing protein [Reticulomyxa filosa]|uniref:WD-40 repeat-containing protein n=1 Tax=Reticulomyxa filosa TaxID=46433 RepID=X6MRF6_RETFI|nr:WD-40 repeat-containing protein [Reticulomyxa filosa]|eukprot:ETO16027.1 WD-40 repeat-containing protein [Reticulomyxa filosa]
MKIFFLKKNMNTRIHNTLICQLWNSRTTNKKLAISLQMGWVMALDYAQSGNFIASGGLDNMCSVFQITEDSVGWETKTANAELRQHEGYISDNKFVDDTKILTASGDSTIIEWDLTTKHHGRTFKDHTGLYISSFINSFVLLSFPPFFFFFLEFLPFLSLIRRKRMWLTNTNIFVGDVMSVNLHPTEKRLFVSGSTDGTVKLWDLRVDKCTQTFRAHSSDVNVARYFPNGRCVASGSDDSTIRLWDIPSRRQVNQYDDLQNKSVPAVADLDFTLSGSTLYASYADPPYCLAWNTLSAEKVDTVLHTVRAPRLRIHPKGHALASGGWDCIVRIFA